MRRLAWISLVAGGCSMENPFFEVRAPAETAGATGSSGADTGVDETTAPSVSTASTGDITTTTGAIDATSGSDESTAAVDPGTGTSETGDASTEPGTSTGGSTSTGADGSTSGEGGGESSTGAPAPFCGDGMKDEGEACDDGNDTPADTCEWNCRPMFEVVSPMIGAHAVAVAAADIDGDKLVDLVLTHANPGAAGPDVSVGRNLGAGQFAWTAINDMGMPGAGPVVIGRVTGDAKLDIVAVPTDGLSSPRLWINTSSVGKIGFTAAVPVNWQPGAVYTAARIVDLNNDAKDDLVFLQSGTGKLHVQRNTGGAFAAANVYTLPQLQPLAIAVGPLLPGDMVPDVYVAYASAANDHTALAGNGDPNGTLTALGDKWKRCTAGAAAIASGDADGGGPLDAVIACASEKAVLVGHDGDDAYVRPLGGALPKLLGAGMLDLYGEDEEADVFVTGADSASVFVGVQVDGKFAAPGELVLPWKVGAAIAAEVTGDGAPDIVVLHPEDARLSVLVNLTRLPAP